jgi:hypothetical protein
MPGSEGKRKRGRPPKRAAVPKTPSLSVVRLPRGRSPKQQASAAIVDDAVSKAPSSSSSVVRPPTLSSNAKKPSSSRSSSSVSFDARRHRPATSMPGRGDEEDEGVKAVAPPPPWEHFVFFLICLYLFWTQIANQLI